MFSPLDLISEWLYTLKDKARRCTRLHIFWGQVPQFLHETWLPRRLWCLVNRPLSLAHHPRRFGNGRGCRNCFIYYAHVYITPFAIHITPRGMYAAKVRRTTYGQMAIDGAWSASMYKGLNSSASPSPFAATHITKLRHD